MSAVKTALFLFIALSLAVMNPWVWKQSQATGDVAVPVSFIGIALLAIIGLVFGCMAAAERRR